LIRKKIKKNEKTNKLAKIINLMAVTQRWM
jgi:hypothetical protein